MDDPEEVKTTVELYIYDLTKGMAAMMSKMLIGRQLEGVWHTGIVAYGREYFFGPAGIMSVRPGGTELKEPYKVERIGETDLPYSLFLDYISGLGTSTFAPGTYNLFKHNCNSFTEEVSNFLVGKGIPKYILDLPEEILQTPIGRVIGPLIENLSGSTSAGFTVGQRFVEARIQREASPEYQLLNTAIEEARLNSIALEERRNVINEKLAKKERKKKKKKKEKKEKGSKSSAGSTGTSDCAEMAESEGAINEAQATNGDAVPMEMSPSERVMQMEEEEKKELEERKRRRDPPTVFKNSVNITAEYENLCRVLDGKLNEDERTCIEELGQYVIENEGSWALGDNFLNFVGRVLYDKSLASDARVTLLKILSAAALKDDVILLLHQDRREHIIMNYAYNIDRHPPEEQLPLAEFMANLFENLSSSEWLLYISEWQHQNQNISNIRVTTKVAVHSLLSNSLELQIRGAAIIHNIACKELHTSLKPKRDLHPESTLVTQFMSKQRDILTDNAGLKHHFFTIGNMFPEIGYCFFRKCTKTKICGDFYRKAAFLRYLSNRCMDNLCAMVFDDIAVELTMALLQYFNGSPEEEQLFACMKSLARFTQISGQDVPQLIQMIGPEPNKFRGTSQRIDEQIDQVNMKLH